ncbi:MAG: hypothetical protein RLN60_02740 [Phycisphaerales bacterium]
MPDPRDIVDFSFLQNDPDRAPGKQSHPAASPRPWIGILFECCNSYARIHKTRDGRAYAGFCPRCNAKIRVPIGEGGTNQRIFRAG